MGIKQKIINGFALQQARAIRRMAKKAEVHQARIFSRLIRKAGNTTFGKDHHFGNIKSPADFQHNVPVRGYEELRPYIDKIIDGKTDVLWPGRPRYFAKTSGTTSGVKYIPITRESIAYHINTARNTILNYVALTGSKVFDGKMIFLSGSPRLEAKGGIPTGRLSGIVNHEVPAWARTNQLPSFSTNCIEDWETKLEAVIRETRHEDMRLISGIPPWVQMYYERLLETCEADTIRSIFPNLKLFVHGGVNYLPYKPIIDKLHGAGVDTLETYPASEGFIAFQDTIDGEGLLLNTNAGMYFEFVDAMDIHNDHPQSCSLEEVEIGKDYALLVSSNAGLWRYNLGDMVRFVSLAPYRIIVSGRVKHFISAFGEHVISKEVEDAMQETMLTLGFGVREFTVAPRINSGGDTLPHHEWLVEFEDNDRDLAAIEKTLDREMCKRNIYYRDLIEGNILSPLHITPLQEGAFIKYMKSEGKLGGQNKVPRLTNDRKIAERLCHYALDKI